MAQRLRRPVPLPVTVSEPAPSGVLSAAQRYAMARLEAYDSHAWQFFGEIQPQLVCRRCLLPLDATSGRCTASTEGLSMD